MTRVARLAALTLLTTLAGAPAPAQGPGKKPAAKAPRPASLQRTPSGDALIEALQEQQYARALALVQRGANPNAVNENGMTALGFAAGSGDLRLVRSLLERGARVNPENPNHIPPLTFAFESKTPDIARLLVEKGARLNTSDGSAFSHAPLVKAIEAGWEALVERMIARGADVNHTPESGMTPLAAAASVGSVPLLTLLTSHGARVEGDREALDLAVLSGSVPALEFLLARGRSLAEPDRDPPRIHLAALSDRPAMLARILEAGADIEKRNEMGRTPLMEAAEGLNTATVSYLIQRKARLDALSDDYRSALDFAQAEQGRPEAAATIAALKRAGAKPAPPSLWRAAAQGQADELLRQLEAGADPNEPDPRGVVPLFYLLRHQTGEELRSMASTLLDHGADPNRTAPDGATLVEAARAESLNELVALLRRAGAETPALELTEAIQRGDSSRVERLLERGTVPESAALAHAIARKEPALLRRLLERGARINAPIHQGPGDFALHTAVDYGDIESARLLLERGADPNLKTDRGSTALAHVAFGTDAQRDAMARLLIERGASVGSVGRNDESVLAALAGTVGVETLTFLLEKAAPGDVNPRSGDAPSPLQNAVRMLRPENVRLLLERGADPNRKASNGDPPLLEVAALGDSEQSLAIARLLMEYGAKLDALDSLERTPLRIARDRGAIQVAQYLEGLGARARIAPVREMSDAIQKGDVATVRRLLDAGFAPDGKVGGDESALHAAARAGQVEVARLLLDRGADLHRSGWQGAPLHVAAGAGHLPVIRLLVERGARIDQDSRSGTPVARAAEASQIGALRLLLKSGADPEARRSAAPGSPLTIALLRGNLDALEPLIKAGANPDGGALGVAAFLGNVDAAQFLVRAGARIGKPDSEGVTPLIRAAQMGQKEMVAWLLERKADVNARDPKGRTALSYALERDKIECVRLLRKGGAKE